MVETFFDGWDEEVGRSGEVFVGGFCPGVSGARVVFEPVEVRTGRLVSVCEFLTAFVKICGAVGRRSGTTHTDSLCALQITSLFFTVIG